MKLAVFRFDANRAIGGGHAVRCLALADALQDTGWRCALAVNSQALDLCGDAVREHADWMIVDASDLAALRDRWPLGCDLLVLDRKGYSIDDEVACRPWAKRLLVIEDLACSPHAADILLDQNFPPPQELTHRSVPVGGKLLHGPRYALVRQRFLSLRNTSLARRVEPGAVSRIFVSLGMTDPLALTPLVLDGLRGLDSDISIDIALGSAAPCLDRLHQMLNDFPQTVNLHIDSPNTPELLADCDLAIGAPGMSAWERCILGIPSLAISFADNQLGNARGLKMAGAAEVLHMDELVSPELIRQRVARLAASPQERAVMSRKAASLCDGQGVFRVVEAIEKLQYAD